jgi:signal transduction histidine kinase
MAMSGLILVYASTLVISSAFSAFLWYSYRDELLKHAFLVWLSVIVGFIAQGIFQSLNLAGFLAYSVNMSTIVILLVLRGATSSTKLPIKRLTIFLFLTLALSVLLFVFGASYMVGALPFSIGCGASLLYGAFYQRPRSPLDGGYRLLLGALSIHFADYPFLRTNEKFAFFGFSMGLVFCFCLSILIPLFVMRKISETHQEELEEKVKNRTAELNEAMIKMSRMNADLAVVNDQLEAVSRDNRSLLNVLVHDLSNPLQTISGASFMMRKKSGAHDEADWMRRIDGAVKDITGTIDHVRSYHAVRHSKFAIRASQVCLNDVVSNLHSDFSEALKKKSLTVEIINRTASKINVMAEESLLKNQILANLLSNAIKFSYPGGRIQITITSDNSTVSLIVRDFGVGIPDEKAAMLFDSGAPTSTVGTSGEKGTGLGLPIVKHYLKSMGGDVKLLRSPEIDAGTEFEINLCPAIAS